MYGALKFTPAVVVCAAVFVFTSFLGRFHVFINFHNYQYSADPCTFALSLPIVVVCCLPSFHSSFEVWNEKVTK